MCRHRQVTAVAHQPLQVTHDAFQQRAGQVAKGFGHEGYKLVKININSSNMRPPVPYARSVTMEAAAAAPVAIEAGTSTLKINVNGTIELK
mgnify:CR=1 FL=1